MDRTKFFKRLALLIFLIFLLNFLANKFYWYSSIWYFDVIMHFLGGFWVGLLALYLFFRRTVPPNYILMVLLCVFLAGASWEIFEYLMDKVISQNPFNALDTAADMFFDLAGGTSALLYFLVKIMPISRNTVQSN